jgi:hypothetical protein
VAKTAGVILAGRVGASPTVHAVMGDGYTACFLSAPTVVGVWNGGRLSCDECARRVNRG